MIYACIADVRFAPSCTNSKEDFSQYVAKLVFPRNYVGSEEANRVHDKYTGYLRKSYDAISHYLDKATT